MEVHLASPLTIASAAVPTNACLQAGPGLGGSVHPASNHRHSSVECSPQQVIGVLPSCFHA